MRPIFQADLVNQAFGDPGLFLDLKFERRALLFDLGDVAPLPTRKILRVSDVFVSHAHMDHWSGFDRLLRVRLGRDKGLKLHGPPGFIEQVGHRLASYAWNLVDSYPVEFCIDVREIREDGSAARARFSSRQRFRREDSDGVVNAGGLLLEEPQFRVRAAFFDHGIPCLGFRFEEGVHINVWKNRLEELGLPTGPWLSRVRRLVREGAPPDTPVSVRWRDRSGGRERSYSLGEICSSVLSLSPGQVVCYLTDLAGTAENAGRVIAFARDADLLFIEAAFLHEDLGHAGRKNHLTARQAGELARLAGARLAVPFHFSPRYIGREPELRQEFEAAFRGDGAASARSPGATPVHE
jgi:ribonuclease Z